MTTIEQEKDLNIELVNNLSKYCPWFYSSFYKNLIKSTKEFFQKDITIRFMGISTDENILFYGDEYFVNNIPINKSANFQMKLSSGVIEYFLDTALGSSEKKFQLNSLTDIEAMLIKSYTLHIYKSLEEIFNKTEVNKKILKRSKNISITFYIRDKKEHTGKIIISIPDYVLHNISLPERKETFTINDFKKTYVATRIRLGKSKIALNEIKAIEDGDIIVLEESNISKMSIILDGKEIDFKINPDPSLIISVNNNGGNEMEEETSVKPQNMWDSILVDIVAEFDNVKLTLGELKQISEGLVIDVGSVYDNKIKLRVENQIVATGELVILNDRYAVRIESVKKAKETPKATQPEEKAVQSKTVQNPKKPIKPQPQLKQKAQAVNENAPKEGDENFDYSDFEIEDESI